MCDSNGKLPWLLQTKKHDGWSKLVKGARPKLQSSPLPVTLGFVLMLFLLAASLTGCAGISTPPANGPLNPEPPPTRLSESLPDYLNSAQQRISEWRKTLQELIQKPAN
jgi:hypothetical protein